MVGKACVNLADDLTNYKTGPTRLRQGYDG